MPAKQLASPAEDDERNAVIMTTNIPSVQILFRPGKFVNVEIKSMTPARIKTTQKQTPRFLPRIIKKPAAPH
ncbi:MAG: hypothetical protein WKF30_10585 [Pyrinomonadaceae bacterium]